jgi:RES domain-containing protein
MIIYRLAIEKYKDDLSGTGSKLFGGRWNSVGIAAIYATENISLSVLEILVRTDKKLIPPHYMLLKIEIPDIIIYNSITKNKLKKNWKEDVDYTQFIGTEFIKTGSTLALKVPSAIVDEENNFILNPLHADFKKVKIKSINKFRFDKRFFLVNE